MVFNICKAGMVYPNFQMRIAKNYIFNVKVCPHYVCVAECNKMWLCCSPNGESNVNTNATRLKQGFCMLRHAVWHENSIGKVSVSSKICRANICGQLYRRCNFWCGIWGVRGFKIFVYKYKLKMRKTCVSHSTVFVTWNMVSKQLFLNVDVFKLAAYAEQLLPRGKAMCCILPCGIVWMHLYHPFFGASHI